MWVALGHTSAGALVHGADIIKDAVDWQIQQYNQDPYEWMWNNHNFELETHRKTGLGDIDLDLFYEHMFSDKWIVEVMVGVRLPTGSDDDYTGNPYKVHLGNGEHWEVKLGGMVAWQPIRWLNVKLDSYFSFVIEATEKRCATFTGAKIKNMGPSVDADVDWQYLVARLDFNFFHPKNKDISSVLGYEFYYKTEDDITFKQTTMTSWAGTHFDTGAANAFALDHKIAEANTESFGHRVRGEARYQVNPWFEIMVGGAWTFAGKNLSKETDAHGGINVRF